MGLFGQLVRTAVNVATLPVKLPIAIFADSVTVIEDASQREPIFSRTGAVLQQIKDDASEEP